MRDEHPNLFGADGLEAWYDEHWQDMPEFSHKDMRPARSIVVHFEKLEDVAAFAEAVGQKIYFWGQVHMGP